MRTIKEIPLAKAKKIIADIESGKIKGSIDGDIESLGCEITYQIGDKWFGMRPLYGSDDWEGGRLSL